MRSRVSEKGQVTIPKAIREQLGIRPGALLDFEEEEGRIVATKAQEGDPLEEAFGIINIGETTDEFVAALRGESESD
ncbi:MAG: AbrB family transcriptional regulator [Acidobacteria bacterium]|nr:MAG: AbrB family transcriptional regulator [Acidobacteriota bacterium]